MHEPPVSIVLRSFNEAWALGDTLRAIAGQGHRNWELIVFDSGSTDGSVELIHAAQPQHFIQLQPREYRPGRVLNQAMRLARHDRVIFLNADAMPQGANWLAPLVSALADPRVAAVFGRQIPRPDCTAPFALDYERCFGARRNLAEWGPFFSMVSSGLRREIWAQRGFNETMQYSEDDEYTRWCRGAGHRIVYVADSVVMHSHNYTPRQAFKRSFGEAWALAGVSDNPAEGGGALRALGGWVRDGMRDFAYCLREKRIGHWPGAVRIRWQQRQGRLHGYRAGWQMHRVDRLLS